LTELQETISRAVCSALRFNVVVHTAACFAHFCDALAENVSKQTQSHGY